MAPQTTVVVDEKNTKEFVGLVELAVLGYQLSTWAASINFGAKNTLEWEEELRDLIKSYQQKAESLGITPISGTMQRFFPDALSTKASR